MQEEYGSPAWRIQGRGPGGWGGGAEPKLRPEGQKICFLGRAPTLQGLYDQPPMSPPYLKVWICY